MRLALHTFVVAVLATSVAHSQTDLVDDFSDGNDDGWTHLLTGFDRVYDATGQNYNLRTMGDVDPGGGALATVWDASDDPSFSNGTLKATVRAETLGTGGHLLLRANAATFDGYGFLVATQYQDASFAIRRYDGGFPTDLVTLKHDDLPFLPGEDWFVEAAAVGDQLSLKAWQDGTPEPPGPQLVTTDSTYSTGLLGVTAGISETASGPAMTHLTWDEIYFTVPEPPTLGDFSGNGVLDAPDIDDLTGQSASGANDLTYDLTGDGLVDVDDVAFWISDATIFNSWVGDLNLDLEFNSTDLTLMLSSGTYENGTPSVWSQGDFNGDGVTDSSDLSAGLASGGYEKGPRTAIAAVPEPSSIVLLGIGLLAFVKRFEQ